MSQDTLRTLETKWVDVQKKTFTKWANSHLRKKGFKHLEDAQEDFQDGIMLMNLINSLYSVDFPKYNKNPRMRIHKLDNISLALDMVEKAEIKTNFLKPVHLCDKDLKMILGMIWAIILDYQIKGISVEELTAKEGLLLWCQKKTAGYRDVKVDNFHTSWQSGLAFCALIHRHRPDLIDYDSLSKENNAENLELAFRIAEDELQIPRLLDVEDLTDVARPDERSVMTYVSEYFHRFASQDVKEKAARRVQKFVNFHQDVEASESDYESRARDLLEWIAATIERMNNSSYGDTAEEAREHFDELKSYYKTEKPGKIGTKLDMESLYAQIQTKLQVNGRSHYVAPEGLTPEDIDAAWDSIAPAEKSYSKGVRDNMFKYITKTTSSVSPEQIAEFEESFTHFDKDSSGFLDPIEFKAVLSTLSIPFKDEEAFNKVFFYVAEGGDKVSKDQFINYMIGISEDKDTKEQIDESFRCLADNGDKISTMQLNVQPLKEGEISYLTSNMPAGEGEAEVYDFASFTAEKFA